jgi:ABC transport system ATP-binding/permease protein
MSNLLLCQSLGKAFGTQQLFTKINLVINSGDRIGLIGPNGSGKSTLLKIICGLEEPDEGQITRQRHVRLSYLAQADSFVEEASIHDNLLQTMSGADLDQVEKEHRIESILSRAEFPISKEPAGLLSGGLRKRLAVCRSLLLYPDILVMDEPTNHLDIEGILWLEKMLTAGMANGPAAYLLVSHDRRVLENCTNRIIELSAVYPEGALQVNGSYAAFVEEREIFMDKQLQEEERLANRMRRETEWLRRGPKARATKAKYRIDEAYKLQDELARVKTRNRATSSVQIEFDATGRKTRKLLEAAAIGKSYGGRQLFAGLDIVLSPGKRLGLLGRNGCGKSTLMRLLAEAGSEKGLRPDSGEIRVADSVRIVYFDQKREQLQPGCTLRRALAPDGDAIVFRDRSLHVVSWAKKFLFRPDQLETPVGQLSGGEQARIHIADLMRRQADILLLDEPTNDLDIPSLEVLEESLREFSGALVLVSHDRTLLDRVCDNLIGFDGRGNVCYFAEYQQWLTEMTLAVSDQSPLKKSSDDTKESVVRLKKTTGRLSYLEQREYDRIEEKIGTAEAGVADLQRQMDLPEVVTDPDRLTSCWRLLEAGRKEVEDLYVRWHELEEKKSS